MRNPCLVLLAAAALSALPVSAIVEKDQPTALLARRYNGYERTRENGGAYRAETFIFAEGGRIPGGGPDPSIDDLPFGEILKMMAGPLQAQNYVAASDPKNTDLMILVYWGATSEGNDPRDSFVENNLQLGLDALGDDNVAVITPGPPIAAGAARTSLADETALMLNAHFNNVRDMENFSKARLLGYHELLANNYNLRYLNPRAQLFDDLTQELDRSRYYVILMAVDFKTAWKEKKLKPLWSAQYSIPAAGNNFAVALPYMTRFAARYFGRDSGGLKRVLNPTGRVEMGELKVLGVVGTPK